MKLKQDRIIIRAIFRQKTKQINKSPNSIVIKSWNEKQPIVSLRIFGPIFVQPHRAN